MIPLKEAYFCINCEHIIKCEKGKKVCPVCGSIVIFPLSKWLNREELNREGRDRRDGENSNKEKKEDSKSLRESFKTYCDTVR